MIASLEERQVHFSQVPFTAFMFRRYCVLCAYFMFFFYLSARLPPRAHDPPKLIFAECEFTSDSSLFYSFSDFVMVNSQVDVFNFEMNVYCRVSVFVFDVATQ